MRVVQKANGIIEDDESRRLRKRAALTEAQEALQRLEAVTKESDTEIAKVISGAIEDATRNFSASIAAPVDKLLAAITESASGVKSSHADAAAAIRAAVSEAEARLTAAYARTMTQVMEGNVGARLAEMHASIKASHERIESELAKLRGAEPRQVMDAIEGLSSKLEPVTRRGAMTFNVQRDPSGRIARVVAAS